MTVYFFTGYHGSGKTFASSILKEQGFEIFDSGPIIRAVHTDSDTILNFEEWVKAGESKFGKNYTNLVIASIIRQRILGHPLRSFYNSVIVGFRSIEGIEFIKSEIKTLIPDISFEIVYFDATPKVLYQRWTKREGIQIPFEEFQLLLQKETLSGLENVKVQSQKIIQNNERLTPNQIIEQIA
jgi:dephospho-CoA kinase